MIKQNYHPNWDKVSAYNLAGYGRCKETAMRKFSTPHHQI